MRILQIVSGTAINGAVMHCRALSLALAEAGHEVTVTSRPDSWISSNLPAHIAQAPSTLKRSYRELQRMAAHIRSARYDVMHTHMSSAHYFGVLQRFLTGTPSVATAHRQCLQLHWMFNDRVIGCSQWASDYQRRVNWVRADRIETIFNFPDVARYRNVPADRAEPARRALRLAPSARVIGFVGQLVQRKGLHVLIQALPDVVRRYPDVCLLVIGAPPPGSRYLHDVWRLAQQLQVASRLHWLGGRPDIPELMRAMEFLVLPTLKDNMPICLLEAMAAGLPVVSTRVGGIPELVQHGVTGLLVPPREPRALAEAIHTLLQSPELRTEFGVQGRQHMGAEFEPAKLVAQITQVLSQAAATRRTPAARRAS